MSHSGCNFTWWTPKKGGDPGVSIKSQHAWMYHFFFHLVPIDAEPSMFRNMKDLLANPRQYSCLCRNMSSLSVMGINWENNPTKIILEYNRKKSYLPNILRLYFFAFLCRNIPWCLPLPTLFHSSPSSLFFLTGDGTNLIGRITRWAKLILERRATRRWHFMFYVPQKNEISVHVLCTLREIISP